MAGKLIVLNITIVLKMFRLHVINPGKRATIVLAFLFGAGPLQSVYANDLAGSDDPALQTAIDVWLQDNDEDSLHLISDLAQKGSIAARLLIARIEETDRASSKFVSGLSRKERVNLFRSTSGKGLFQPSWLKSETEAGNQFASALFRSTALEVNIDAIKTLYDIGETESTYDLIRQVAANGSQQEKEELSDYLPEASELSPYLRALQTPEAGVTPGITALQKIISSITENSTESISSSLENDTGNAASFVEFGYQTGVESVDFDESNGYYNDLASWIKSALPTAPISTLCHQYCDDEAMRACAVTAFGLVGGYYKAIRFDSPLESLISQSRFTSSDRAAGMLLRRISSIKSANGNLLISDSKLRLRSLCLAKAVAKTRS